jgi:hypothetical protein
MGRIGHVWTEDEEKILNTMRSLGATDSDVAKALGLSYEQIRHKRRYITREHVKESPFPKYNKPLVMEGDAVVLPDIEFPFHNAEFLNKVLELASEWNIHKCIVAGDVMHFSSLSSFDGNWVAIQDDGISDEVERTLMDFAMRLPSSKQQELIDLVMELNVVSDDGEPNLSAELKTIRREILNLSNCFDEIHFVLGNHDSRFLRALQSPIFPEELLRLVEAPLEKWKVAPYYYSRLVSGGEVFQIEHPTTAAKYAAVKIASIHQCHVLMAHSHHWSMEKDPSGRFWAIQMGCVVDEDRLPYAAQRHSGKEAHMPGAVIVRDGYPFLLGEETPFDLFASLGGE